jgi:hypothetical protein
MAKDAEGTVPEGAAVFPVIPAEVGINPLLLAVIHATIFLAGSAEELVDPGAADEAIQQLADYFGRLKGSPLQQVREDMDCLISYARQQGWAPELVEVLKNFLADFGVETKGKA